MAAAAGRVVLDYTPGAPEGQRLAPAGGWGPLWRRMLAELAALADKAGGTVRLEVRAQRYSEGRTLAQNRMLWALLKIMADTINAGRIGPDMVTDMDCYMDMLATVSDDFVYLDIQPEALKLLQQRVRTVRVVDILPGGRLKVRAYNGSSQFTRAQMHKFLEGVFDRLAQLDCTDADMMYYHQQWREADARAKRERAWGRAAAGGGDPGGGRRQSGI